ncbi:MAG TPA: hypothetical protein PLW86_04695 [Rhodocyclaceae bacterium]|nr:hypothetical protein [Rhodocyclaceae bacterium]
MSLHAHQSFQVQFQRIIHRLNRAFARTAILVGLMALSGCATLEHGSNGQFLTYKGPELPLDQVYVLKFEGVDEKNGTGFSYTWFIRSVDDQIYGGMLLRTLHFLPGKHKVGFRCKLLSIDAEITFDARAGHVGMLRCERGRVWLEPIS